MLRSVLPLFSTFITALRTWGRGGAVTRTALLLALMALFYGGMAGCRAPEPPHLVRKRIQLGSLLSLHPLWQGVVNLDRTIARLRTRSGSTGTVGSALSSLPPTLPVPPTLSSTVMEARRLRARDYEADYLRQLAETLRMQDDIYLSRRARSEDKDAEAAYRRELADRISLIRGERIRQAEVLDREIDRLQFRDVPFQVQQNVYKGQGLQDARLQHDLLVAQIDKLTHDAETLVSPSIISDLAVKSLQGRREALLTAARERVASTSRDLATARAKRIQEEEGKLTNGAEPVTSISRITLPDPGPEQAPLVLSPVQIEQSAMQTANGVVGESITGQAHGWQEERNVLLTAIRMDTEQAVQQIASKRGWTVVIDGGPESSGLPDVTEEMKTLIRSQWHHLQ